MLSAIARCPSDDALAGKCTRSIQRGLTFGAVGTDGARIEAHRPRQEL
jgi:hypothetical protein